MDPSGERDFNVIGHIINQPGGVSKAIKQELIDNAAQSVMERHTKQCALSMFVQERKSETGLRIEDVRSLLVADKESRTRNLPGPLLEVTLMVKQDVIPSKTSICHSRWQQNHALHRKRPKIHEQAATLLGVTPTVQHTPHEHQVQPQPLPVATPSLHQHQLDEAQPSTSLLVVTHPSPCIQEPEPLPVVTMQDYHTATDASPPVPGESGYEFGYTPFEELPAAQVEVVEEVIIAEDCGSEEVLLLHERPVKIEPPVKVPIPDHKMMELQEQDEYVSRLRAEWQLGRLDANYFKMERDVLRKRITINGVPYEPVILPGILHEYVLMLAHNEQGHNGSRRTYNALRYVYYWKGMKNAVERHCKRCYTCAKFNIRVHKLKKQHFKVPAQPMEFISMDLIGEFHPPSSKGNRYALTAICMLTGFTFCIPLKSKTAKDVVTAYMDNIYCVFGPSRRILTDNGTEFRNKFWEQVFKDTRMSHLTSPIYSPQCNGRIEGFHKFLKATIGKQLHRGLEWDDVIPQATSAYNFFPTESSKESPFFLMFGRQPAVKHMLSDSESTKYLGDDEGKLKIEVMRKLYHVIAYNLAKSRAARDGNKRDEENKPEEEQFEPGTNILVRDHTKKVFHAEYTDHTVVEQVGKNQFVVKDNHGQEKKVHRSDMKEINSDVKIAELYKELRDEGNRDEKHCMPIKQIPDLGWKAPEAAEATPAGDPDNQSLRSPPPATSETPPAGDSDKQSVRTKTPKFPQLEPMPQRKTPLRRSERIKKKMDTINEIVDEKVVEPTPQGNETLNIFKLAVTTSFAAACAIAVKTLEMQVFQA